MPRVYCHLRNCKFNDDFGDCIKIDVIELFEIDKAYDDYGDNITALECLQFEKKK